MSFIRSLVSKCCTYIILVILLFSKIIPIYLYYTKKKLVYIIIIASFSCQSFSYLKCTKLNIYLSYNIRLVLDIKYL